MATLNASLNAAISRLGTFRTTSAEAATAANNLARGAKAAERDVGAMATKAGSGGGLFGKLKSGLGLAEGGMKGLNAAMKDNAFGLLLMLLQPLIEKFVDMVTHSKTVQAVIQKVFKVVGEVIGSVCTFVKGVIDQVWPYISATIKTVVTVVMDLVKFGFGIIKAEIEITMTIVKTIITVAWNVIKAVFTTTLDVIKAVVSGAWSFISGVFKNTFDGIMNAVDTVWNSIKNVITGAIHSVSDTMSSVWSGLSGIAKTAFETVLSVVKTPINAIIDLVNTCIDGLNSIHVSIPDWVPVVGGSSFGIHLPHIPTLAEGGIVLPRPGGTLAVVGEGGQAEAVLPLSKLSALLAAQRGPRLAAAGAGGGLTVTNYYEAEHGSARRTAEELLFLAKARG